MSSSNASLEQSERVALEFVAQDKRFLTNGKNFEQQYNQIYRQRLSTMRGSVRQQAIAKWGADAPTFDKIIDSENQQEGTDGILIGTLYKELALRGSVLEEVKTHSNVSSAMQPISRIVSDDDQLVLEDESGRVSLTGSICTEMHQLVTGIILAVKGHVNTMGEFEVNDWAFYNNNMASCDDAMVTGAVTTEPAKYVMLVSGLNAGEAAGADKELAAQLLVDFVSGRLPVAAGSVSVLPSQIGRVIIAGDSCAAADPGAARDRATSFRAQSQSQPAETTHQLDILLSQLLISCPVDLLPGAHDPSSFLLPQPPLHRCLLPISSRFSTLNRATNPFQGTYANRCFLGHSGQPIIDIARQTAANNAVVGAQDATNVSAAPIAEGGDGGGVALDGEACLDILCSTLQWGHLAPTCPDTLPCYPFVDRDPFIIQQDSLPDVYFAGNQPKFCHKLLTLADKRTGSGKHTRVVCLPSFANTGTVALVNLASPTLDCFQLCFQ